MTEREFTDESGLPWTFTERKRVRQEEAERFVVVVATSPFETRIVRCERERWQTPRPDFARLLAESLPAGGSRGSQVNPDGPPDMPSEDSFLP